MRRYEYEYVTDAERLPQIAAEIGCASVLFEDLETTGISPFQSQIRLWSINTGSRVYVIDVFRTGRPDPIIKAHEDNRNVIVCGQNCLAGTQEVLLADGRRVRLSKLVDSNDPGPVVCLNEATNTLDKKRIVGWVKSSIRPWDDWVRVRVSGKGCLWLTKDHEILTTRGRVQAQDVKIGDRIYTSLPEFTEQQSALIYGSLLGDASIVRQKSAVSRTAYFSVSHSLVQADYLKLKADVLGDTLKKVTDSKPDKRGYGARTGVVMRVARTRSDGRFLEVFNNTVVLDKAWFDKLTPAALAVWYCDDGYAREGIRPSIAFSAFGFEGAERMCEFLNSLGYPAEINKRKSDGYLYIDIGNYSKLNPDEGQTKFWRDISPFVPYCMRDKLPENFRPMASDYYWYRPLLESRKAWADEVVEIGPLLRKPGDKRRHGGSKKSGRGLRQYCLVVEDNANFISSGLAVSNCKFDQKFLLYHYDLEFGRLFDTFRASELMYNGKKSIGHNLYDLYRRELKLFPKAPDLGGSDWNQGDLTDDQLDYAAEDVIFLPKLRDVMKAKLEALGLNKVALIEFQAILPESAVELNGFYLNPKAWRELADSNKTTADTLKYLLWKTLPDPACQMTLPGMQCQFNLDSPKQLLQSLHRMGVKIDNTSEVQLIFQSEKHPIINQILEYREAATQLKMFGKEYLDFVNPITHRIHPEYFPYLLAGRYAISKPNLGQIPRDKRFRSCFQAEEGNLLVLSDFSAIEMCIVAEISKDDVLISVLNGGKDVHRYTASILTGKPESEVAKSERQAAKPVNFGFCLVPGTTIFTESGNKMLQDVKVGDLVYTHKNRLRPVTAIQRINVSQVLKVSLSDGRILKCTPDHAWYCYVSVLSDETIKTRKLWVPAECLAVGDFILPGGTSGSLGAFVREVELVEYEGEVIDLTVAEDHSFVANGLISHNCYGMGAERLVLYARGNYGVSLTIDKAKEFREKYFERYRGVARWHERAIRDGKVNKVVRTLANRLRYIEEDGAYSELLNTPVQGTGADGLKNSLRKVYERLKALIKQKPVSTLVSKNPKVKMVHHVHDEIITESNGDPELISAVKRELSAGMIEGMQPFLKNVKVTAEASVGKTWADKA